MSNIAVLPLAPVLGSSSEKSAERVTSLLQSELGKSEAFRVTPLAGAAPSGRKAPQPIDEAEGDTEGGSGITEVPVPAPEESANDSGNSVRVFQGAGAQELAHGKVAIGLAEKEMRRLRFDGAVENYQEGIAALESAFDSLTSFQILTDAYLGVAIAQLRLGHREEGQKALEAVVRLSPDMSLARSQFPAIFVRMFNQARERLSGSKGSLSVASTPAGRAISLDGRSAGVTPVTLTVLPGRHFVVVHAPSGLVPYRVDVPEGGLVQVGGGSARQVSASQSHRPATPPAQASAHGASSDDLRTVREEIRANLIDGPGDVALRRIAKATGAQYLVLGGLHVQNGAGDLALDLLLYAVGPDQLAPLPRFKLDGDLLGAQVEIYKAVQRLAAKARPQGFPDALTLPAPVAPDFNPSHEAAPPLVLANQTKTAGKPPPRETGAAASGAEEDDDQITLTTGHTKPKPKPRGDGEARAEGEGSGARTLTAESAESQALGTPGVEDTGEKKGGGGATWTIVGITVLALAAAGVGAYFIYEAATAKPSAADYSIGWHFP